MSEHEYLLPVEVAELLRKSKSWVYAAVERGELPHLRIGRDLRFKRADIDAWLERQYRRPEAAELKVAP